MESASYYKTTRLHNPEDLDLNRRPLGRPIHKWESDIKMYLKGMVYCVEWI